MKRYISIITLLIFVAGLMPLQGALNSRKVQAIIAGEFAKSIKVYDFSGDDYCSVRQLADLYGANLAWHPVTGKVTLTMQGRKLDIYIKSTRIILSGKKKRLSIPTRSSSGDVFVPLSFILSKDFSDFSDSMSTWNPEAKVLTIEKRENIATPRFYSRPGSTQIVIELLEDLKFGWSQDKKDRIVISFPRGQIAKDKIAVDDGAVKTISVTNENRQAVITVALDNGAGKVEKKVLKNPLRLAIDVERISSVAEKKEAGVELSSGVPAAVSGITSDTIKGPLLVLSSPAVSIPAAPAAQAHQKKKLIVLDAGHGGDDPGAIGRNSTKEKDINLAIVKELKRVFEDNGEYDIFLTRSDDTFIPLVDRTNMANERKADLFVSIHSNASMKKDTGGFEIYFLSEKASDADAAATAILENSVINLENKPTKKQSQLQEMLWSMVVNEFINESSELCSHIAVEVTRRIKIENRGVKQAGFYVLRGAQMPAVLVECAFLSNIKEEAQLNRRKFQRQMADSIYEAIRNYDVIKNGKKTMNARQYRVNGNAVSASRSLE